MGTYSYLGIGQDTLPDYSELPLPTKKRKSENPSPIVIG
jgi:hypothetical protein